ncbi:MAG: YaiI/YqxD family protein [Gemmatimonadetes bacterium]|nr:YaiI/YqxD family protein [Gemmatimonadota bacterium]MDA1102097.1 YaiI/YqxD family protein [Gemmatimonadota bacterium]
MNSDGPTIYVDADSCPVKEETYRVAKRYDLRVILVAAQWLRIPTEPWLEIQVVKEDGQLDAADDWIAERAGEGDIVITQDISLASRCLESSARVIGPRGVPFTPESIGEALAGRELMANLREMGEISGGSAPFGKRDRSNFLQALDQAVQAIRRGR